MNNEILQFMFWRNYYVSFHIICGGIGARIFKEVLTPVEAIILIFGITILWEVIEYYLEGISTYGTTKRWLLDCAGDIVGAIICAALVLF